MKYVQTFYGVLLVAATLHVDDKAPPLTNSAGEVPNTEAKTDTAAQDGVWKPIAAVLGGQPLPEPVLKAITLTIKNGNYEVTVEGEEAPDKGTCTLDTSTTPKRMTIKSTSGPNNGKTFLAIYEMKDANSLRVCYDLSGKEFPKEFNAPKGTPLYLADYRLQPEKSKPATKDK